VRLAAAPVAALAVHRSESSLALVLFVLAVTTDLLDGPLARRRGEASPLGGLLDHATDALFVSLGLLACAGRGLVPLWLPLLVLASFAQYTLDSRALEGRSLRGSALGRWNGIAYFVLLGVPVVRDGLGIGWPPDGLVRLLGWALVGTTLLSMALRARSWRATAAG
jgi:phosphatidylglycerophosphate synthase